MLKKKLKKIKTEGLQQLPYISPWIHIDSSRELEHQLAKTKLMEGIAMPQHSQRHHIKNTPSIHSQSNNISPRKINSNRNQSAEDHKGSTGLKSSVAKIKNCNSFICSRDKNKKQIIEKTIFVRKRPPSSKIRVISLGNETQCSKTVKLPTKVIDSDYSPDCRSHNSVAKDKKRKIEPQNKSKRIIYKRISLSLLNNLTHSSQQIANKKLSKTLQNFINLQQQI